MHHSPQAHRPVNGTRTHFIPQEPDSILLSHILATQRWHSAEIVRLSTQLTPTRRRRKARRSIQELPQWTAWAWGGAMLMLTWLSPETVNLALKLMAAFRG